MNITENLSLLIKTKVKDLAKCYDPDPLIRFRKTGKKIFLINPDQLISGIKVRP